MRVKAYSEDDVKDSCIFTADINDIDLFPFGFGILNCVPSAARLLAVPNGKDCIGVVYHIIVPNEHASAEVVIVYQRYFICLFKDVVVSFNFTWRPFHCLIWAGNSAF